MDPFDILWTIFGPIIGDILYYGAAIFGIFVVLKMLPAITSLIIALWYWTRS